MRWFAFIVAFLFAVSAIADTTKKLPQRLKKDRVPAAVPKKKIDWISTPWVDIPGLKGETSSTAGGYPDGEKENSPSDTLIKSLKTSLKSPGTSSSGGAGGGDNGGEPVRIGFDDNMPKLKEGGEAKGGNTGKGPSQSGPGDQPKAQAIAFKRWWPMCVFADPAVPNANGIVKKLVDMAAECQVNLVVYPFYMKSNYPKNAGALKGMIKRTCNAAQGLKQLGANRASALALVNDKSVAAGMCGVSGAGVRDKFGCSEVGFDPGKLQESLRANTGEWGGKAKGGETAVGVVGPGGFNAPTAAKYGLGGPMMSAPPGNGAGNGSGAWYEGNASAGSAPQEGWTQQGCQQMRSSAFPNNGQWKYNPAQELYLTKGPPDRQFDLTQGISLFRPPEGAPVAAVAGGGGGGAKGGGGGSAGAGGEGALRRGGTALEGGKGGGFFEVAGPGAGHKGLVAGKSGSGSALRGGGSAAGNRSGVKTVSGGYGQGSGGSSTTDVAEALAADAEAAEGGVAEADGVGGKGEPGATVDYDDKVRKGGLDPLPVVGAGAAGAAGTAGATGAAAGAGTGYGAGASGAGASLTQQVREGSRILDDDFFKKIGKDAEGASRRRDDGPTRSPASRIRGNIYQ